MLSAPTWLHYLNSEFFWYASKASDSKLSTDNANLRADLPAKRTNLANNDIYYRLVPEIVDKSKNREATNEKDWVLDIML